MKAWTITRTRTLITSLSELGSIGVADGGVQEEWQTKHKPPAPLPRPSPGIYTGFGTTNWFKTTDTVYNCLLYFSKPFTRDANYRRCSRFHRRRISSVSNSPKSLRRCVSIALLSLLPIYVSDAIFNDRRIHSCNYVPPETPVLGTLRRNKNTYPSFYQSIVA